MGTPREGEAGYKAQAFSGTGGDVKIILLILCKLCRGLNLSLPHRAVRGGTGSFLRRVGTLLRGSEEVGSLEREFLGESKEASL